MASSRASENLLRASREAFEAVQAGDLEGLSRALDARAVALEAGATPTPEILALGEAAFEQLACLQAAWSNDDKRLEQLEHVFTAGGCSLIDIEA